MIPEGKEIKKTKHLYSLYPKKSIMSKATELSLKAGRLKRVQTKEENVKKRSSFGGFGKGSTSGSTYLKRGSGRSAYSSKSYGDES